MARGKAEYNVTRQPVFKLRDYQIRTIQAIREALKKHRSVLATAPTGAGKTVMLAEMAREAVLRGYRCDVVVHREELIRQSVEKLRDQTGIEPGVVWQGRREWEAPIRVLAHGTVTRYQELPPEAHRAEILFLDEAHHATAPGWRVLVDLLQPTWLVGMTATPFRQDKEPLTPTPFEVVIRTITPQELIDAGMLVPPVVESPAVSNSRGEPEPIGKAGNLPGIYHKAVRYAIGNGRNKIILYVSGTPNRTPTEIGFATQSLLRGAGIPTGVVHEGCNSREREAISRAFEKYDTAVLANFMTLTEGFDSTCVDCVILGRRTTSESTLIQMIGRGLRLHAGKEDCLVLDFTGRNDVHDVLSYWRLDGQRDKPEKDRAERSAKVSDDDLDSLQLALPDVMNAMADTTADYPWFSPFSNRRISAMRLWDPDEKSRTEKYVCVEPTASQKWKVSTVQIPRRKTSNPTRITRAGLSSQEAADAVLKAIGNRGRLYRRDASWRQQPATDRQRSQWERINETEAPDEMKRGEASDAIARRTFQENISDQLL